MSIIATKWAYSQEISAPVDKNVLVFLATHIDGCPQSNLSAKTIARATSFCEEDVLFALRRLNQSEHITINHFVMPDGRSFNRQYILNIDQKYLDDHYSAYDSSVKRKPTGVMELVIK